MSILINTTEPLVKNSFLKTKRKHRTVHNLTEIYGSTIQFKIDKEVEKLAQDYLEFELTSESNATGFTTLYLGARIMSSIIIRNESGTAILDDIKPQKVIYLLEKMKGNTGMYDVLNSMITPPNDFTAATSSPGVRTCTLKVPLMFFYCFPWSEYLDIRETESLIIECRVSSKLDMGMEYLGTLVGLTGLKVSLYQEYYTKSRTYSNMYQSYASTPIARTIPKTFKTWYDTVDVIESAATSFTKQLNCDLPTNNIIALIYEKSKMFKITAYQLSLNGNFIVGREGDISAAVSTDYDFNLTNQSIGSTQVKHLNYYFDQKSSNVLDSNDYITFSAESNMCPAYLTLYFDAAVYDRHLYVFYDVPTKYIISQDRSVSSNKSALPEGFINYSGKFTRTGVE